MKEKLIRFMYGRYGIDSLGKFLLIAGLIALFLSGRSERPLWIFLSWALLLYEYFRMFSRNIYKRSAENQWYLGKTASLRTFFFRQRDLMRQRKTHHIYKCPTCRQKIRIPRGKGRVEIRCPKCGATFIKRS